MRLKQRAQERVIRTRKLFSEIVCAAAAAAISIWSIAAVQGINAQQPRAKTASVSAPQFAQWREAIKRVLYIPDALPTLDTKSYGSFDPAPGVVAERVSYRTLYGMRVPAIVYSPAGAPAKQMPAIVVVNGHGGDKYSWYSFYTGILYARAGGVVLTYDPVGEGERNGQHKSGTRVHDHVVNGPNTGERIGGQMITDVMQAVSYLRGRRDVDANRIAIAGYSMGSFVSALTGAVDPRIHAVVLSGGGDLDGNRGYWDSSNKVMCQGRPYQALSFLPDKAAAIYALNQRRGPTFIINGRADTVVDIPHHQEPFFADLRRRTEALTGTDRNIFTTYFIPDVSHRPSWVTRPAALWLQRTMHFPGWTEAVIERLPETHISDWAAKNHVDMDKGYIQEDREGGVMALRDDVPNVPRNELNVLPEAEWQREKGDFVYGTWVQRALQADGVMGDAAATGIRHR